MKARWTLVLASLTVLVLRPSLGAFNPNGRHWPAAPIAMTLEQPSSGAMLADGSADWDAVTEHALQTWNAVLNGVSFTTVRGTGSEPALFNSVNDVVWSDDVYGDPFGDGVLAVTMSVYTVDNNTAIEADVLFNRSYAWNSYRGPLRRADGGGLLVDMHRVAIHEFGHVLGLDHPDAVGQAVDAVMNSHTSDVETLQQDDVDGVASIYGRPSALPALSRLIR